MLTKLVQLLSVDRLSYFSFRPKTPGHDYWERSVKFCEAQYNFAAKSFPKTLFGLCREFIVSHSTNNSIYNKTKKTSGGGGAQRLQRQKKGRRKMKITGILRCMHTTMATTDATRPKTSKLRCQLFERQATAAEVQPGSTERNVRRQDKTRKSFKCENMH